MYANLNPNLRALLWIALFFAIVVPICLHIGKKQNQQLALQYSKSLSLYNQGDYVGAEQAIRTRISMGGGGNFAPYYYQLGRCLLQQGRMNGALADFHEAASAGNGYLGGKLYGWIRPDPVTEHKAQAAVAWIQQNPNWQPAAPGQTSTSHSPPQDFPAT